MMTKDENLLESIRLNILFDKGMVFVPFILKGVVSSFDHPEVLLVLFVEGKMCDKKHMEVSWDYDFIFVNSTKKKGKGR